MLIIPRYLHFTLRIKIIKILFQLISYIPKEMWGIRKIDVFIQIYKTVFQFFTKCIFLYEKLCYNTVLFTKNYYEMPTTMSHHSSLSSSLYRYSRLFEVNTRRRSPLFYSVHKYIIFITLFFQFFSNEKCTYFFLLLKIQKCICISVCLSRVGVLSLFFPFCYVFYVHNWKTP